MEQNCFHWYNKGRIYSQCMAVCSFKDGGEEEEEEEDEEEEEET